MAPPIVLVRHGETEWTVSGRHTGTRADIPLSEAGRRHSEELGKTLAGRTFSLILISPLLRARQTCELAGFGDGAEVNDDLCEWDYGDYEGLTTPQIHEQNPTWNLWTDGCPGGEAPAQVGARADRVIERARAADGNVIAFGHGHILRVVAARWTESEVAFGARLALDAGSISALGFERETQVVSRWNS
jgi:broad specificity phosphatase PhoE